MKFKEKKRTKVLNGKVTKTLGQNQRLSKLELHYVYVFIV